MTTLNLHDDCLERVLPEVHLAPGELAVDKLRSVIREFCQFTRAWQYTPPSMTIALNQAQYTIPLPGDYGTPIAVEWLQVDGGSPATPRTVTQFDEGIPTWRTRAGNDYSQFTQESPKTFIFSNLPIAAGTANGLKIRVSLKPTPDAVEIDEDLWEEWYEVLCSGTKAELLMMDGKPWGNPKLALVHQGAYQRGRQRARIRHHRSFGNVEQQWRGKYKFA